MTILSFCEKKSSREENKVQAHVQSQGELDGSQGKELSRKTNGKLIQLNNQSRKVIHFNKFQLLRQAAKWENSKLRNGLSLKVHQLRREIEQNIPADNSNSIDGDKFQGVLLDLASEYSDFMLYGEATTVQLLNKYTEFKDLLNLKFEEFTMS